MFVWLFVLGGLWAFALSRVIPHYEQAVNSIAIRNYYRIPTIEPSRQGYRGGGEVSAANARYGAVPIAQIGDSTG